jgi:hypothetical protein
MSLWDCVFTGGIAGFSLFGTKLSLAGDAALDLTSDFLGAALFERVSTSPYDERACANDRQGLHLLILLSPLYNARMPRRFVVVAPKTKRAATCG